ncbi:hypothetical protein Scep_012820 [Stephania cephalantha]|uniref:Uncharacterized protein n=1 Tax=Stephania cephalantha TaxID=152367 RepID=A0AAP0JI35_9MAGN
MKKKRKDMIGSEESSDGAEVVSMSAESCVIVPGEPSDHAAIALDSSLDAVERILRYKFKNRDLLEEALTHSSYTEAESYQRLEFVGDAALGLAVANFVYITYPGLDPGHLSLIRAANISTEKLARVAVRHALFRHVRHNAPCLNAKVEEFAQVVAEEGDEIPHSGSIKAPKVLADIVESIAAAVYVDCNFDLKQMWDYFGHVLEPIVTLETLQHQPVTTLYELCQKQGKQVDIRHWRKGAVNIANIFVDGKLVGSGCSEQKDIAKINAAKEALDKLWKSLSLDTEVDIVDESTVLDGKEIDGAKQKLNEFCNKKRWHKPTYRMEKEVGPAHDRKFICSVHIDSKEGTYVTVGDMKLRLRDAENSAASNMLYGLQNSANGVVLVS